MDFQPICLHAICYANAICRHARLSTAWPDSLSPGQTVYDLPDRLSPGKVIFHPARVMRAPGAIHCMLEADRAPLVCSTP